MNANSQCNFTENIKDIINLSKSSISSHNNELVNWMYYSQVKTLKWVLDQNENNNLKLLKKIVSSKIQSLKREKKKAMYRIDVLRITYEIDNLKFCLKAIIQDINRINAETKVKYQKYY